MTIQQTIFALNFHPVGRRLILLASLPFLFTFELFSALRWLRHLLNIRNHLTHHSKRDFSHSPKVVDDATFPGISSFDAVLDKLEETGLRSTAGKNHNIFIDWLEEQLSFISGLQLRSDYYEIPSWETVDDASLRLAGELRLGAEDIPIVGAVPLSRPGSATAALIYIPSTISITSVDPDKVQGKIILRDFVYAAYPYSLTFMLAHSKTSDLYSDTLRFYDRPHSGEWPCHIDLLDAVKVKAVGIIHIFDIVGRQVESYFEPHQGIHYGVPGLFVGVDEGEKLKLAEGEVVTIGVKATVGPLPTRNLIAVLPGLTDERIVICSHTDGNTLVQENGVAALLTLADYFSTLPIADRTRTIEFVFGTAHLQVADEGLARHALQLVNHTSPPVACIAVEHMGTREIEPIPRRDGGLGRELVFSGRNEMMLWSVGPSPPILAAVNAAVIRRTLDRTLVTCGTTLPDRTQVPAVEHFGGIGTFYHQCLFPTTAMISGPWSLWAPCFGRQAVDVHRLRQQTMAVGDVYLALASSTRSEIMGEYEDYQERAKSGAKRALWPIDKIMKSL